MELRAEGVSRRFFRENKGSNFFYALKDASIALSGGELTEVYGRSGSGKSTLLNVLTGLLEPDEGAVYIDGEDIYALSDEERSALRNRRFGIVPQGQSGLGSLSVLENVLLPYTMYGEEAPEEEALSLLSRMGIEKLKNAYPDELSGGELRRLAIARALVRKPDFVFADEPTGDLDDENTEEVLKLFRELADSGISVLMVTHEKAALSYADRIFRMNDGALCKEGALRGGACVGAKEK